MSRKTKTIRNWMFVENCPERLAMNVESQFGLHRDDFKEANRILHRQENKQKADRLFGSIMSQVGAPIDANYSATIKGLSTGDLVLLVKVGNRLARLAEAAKARLERQYQTRELAKTVTLDRRDRNLPKSVQSTPLSSLTDAKLLWVQDLWQRKNVLNSEVNLEVRRRNLEQQVKVA